MNIILQLLLSLATGIIIRTSDLQPSTAIANQLPGQLFLHKLEP